MTLSSTLSKDGFDGNGSTTEFPVSFMFLRDADVEVVLRDTAGRERLLVAGTDYHLSGAGDSAGGACSMTVAPAAGESLHLRRNPAIVQETDYPENDAFPAASHEAALDYLTMICQSLAERLDRTLSFRVSSAVSGVTLPEPAPDRVLAWNGTGDDLENRDVVGAGSVLLPLPVDQGGTGADNVTEALFNLGFGVLGAALAGCESGDEAVAAMDPDILRAHTPRLLRAAYGDEMQEITEDFVDESVTFNRNHIKWVPTGDVVTLTGRDMYPYDGTYVIHLYPTPGVTGSVLLGDAYKLPPSWEEPDPNAGEVRIVVEVFNGRKSIVSIQNMEA